MRKAFLTALCAIASLAFAPDQARLPLQQPPSGLGVWPGGGASPVNLPTEEVDTSYTLPTSTGDIDCADTPTGGVKTLVCDTGDDFQDALDGARRGDIIELTANVSFTGPFTIPDKGAGDEWVYVVSSNLADLPAVGNRVNPDLGGTCNLAGALPCNTTPNTDRADMPKIVSGGDPNTWFYTAHGADKWRFVGIDFVPGGSTFLAVGIRLYESSSAAHATLAEKTSDFIFDRCIMQGRYSSPWAGRAVVINGNRHAVINSYIYGWVRDDQDTQGILANAYASVFSVINNYLEATGENFYTDNVETISGTDYYPCDGTVRGNLLRHLGAEWDSGLNNVKNLLEMKAGCRMLFEANWITSQYRRAQETAVNIKIGDEGNGGGGGAPYLKNVFDVTVRHNRIQSVANFIKACQSQCNSANNTNIITGIAIFNNVADDISTDYGNGSDGHAHYQVVTGPRLYIERNTYLGNEDSFSAAVFQRGVGVSDGEILRIRGNILKHVTNTLTGAEVTAVSSAASYTENLIVGGPSCSTTYPSGNACPANEAAIGFTDYNDGLNGDYSLAGGSSYLGTASDVYDIGGTDPGANFAKVAAYTGCAYTGQCAAWDYTPAAPRPAPLARVLGLRKPS